MEVIMNWYPLRFEPVFKTVIWGGSSLAAYKGMDVPLESVGESWEVSAVPGAVSVVADGPLAGRTLSEVVALDPVGLLGQSVHDRYGTHFPLLMKFIDAAADLSIQVHPDDAMASRRHQTFGKTELWYVVAAKPGARLVVGFSTPITPDEYERRIADNTIEEVLCYHYVQPGDVFFLPAGRVHAIGAGILLAEIQQSSDITYRLYDYNRKDVNGQLRELHTELAKEAIDYTLYPYWRTDYPALANRVVPLVKCAYFTTNRLHLKADEAGVSTLTSSKPSDSFAVVMCLEGEGWLSFDGQGTQGIRRGQTLLVPAAIRQLQLGTSTHCLLLETYIDG